MVLLFYLHISMVAQSAPTYRHSVLVSHTSRVELVTPTASLSDTQYIQRSIDVAAISILNRLNVKYLLMKASIHYFRIRISWKWCWTKRGRKAMKRHHNEPPKKWAWWVLLSQLRAPTGVSRTILVQVVSFMLAKIRFVHQSGVFSIWGASSRARSLLLHLLVGSVLWRRRRRDSPPSKVISKDRSFVVNILNRTIRCCCWVPSLLSSARREDVFRRDNDWRWSGDAAYPGCYPWQQAVLTNENRSLVFYRTLWIHVIWTRRTSCWRCSSPRTLASPYREDSVQFLLWCWRYEQEGIFVSTSAARIQ